MRPTRPPCCMHRSLVEAAAAAERGVIVSYEGDAVFAAFASAGGAVRAAVEAQRAIARPGVEWRRRPRPDGHPHRRGTGGRRATTSGSRSTARPGSARPPTVARSSSPTRRASSPASRGADIATPRPRRAPPQGLRETRAAVPGRGGRPRDDLPRAPHARPHAQQPAAAAHHLRRPSGGRQGGHAARPDAPAHAHRARRDGQDTTLAGARERLRRALPGRRVVRAAGAGHRRGARRLRDRRVARPARARSVPRSTGSRSISATAARCSCSTTSSRSSPGRRWSPTSCARRPS